MAPGESSRRPCSDATVVKKVKLGNYGPSAKRRVIVSEKTGDRPPPPAAAARPRFVNKRPVIAARCRTLSRSRSDADRSPAITTAGSADSASGGSGGSGMECLQLRSPPGAYDYLISEQAKSLVALQELQNEVGALLEFRDLVIETFPNLRSKMAPSTPASGVRRDWEPGVRVRRKLAGSAGDTTRTKPQPSVQDSGFSTETSCGKDASASATASASRSRPVEDELWALLDVIQRKGQRLRDEAELLRGELDERHSPAPRESDTAEESFARALSTGCVECACDESRRLRRERDVLLARSAELEAEVAARLVEASPGSPPAASTPPPRITQEMLGRLDQVLGTSSRPPKVSSTPSKKFAAILQESSPVELQRQLLTSTVMAQVLSGRLCRAIAQRAELLERLERTREENDDLKFQLEEKSIELEGTKARVRMFEGKQRSNEGEASVVSRSREHSSMRDMEPLQMPDAPGDSAEARIAETPRRSRPSRIPLHTAAHKGAAPKPPVGRAPPPAPAATPVPAPTRDSVSYRSRSGESPARPPSAHSCRSHRHSLTRSARNDSYNSVKKDSTNGAKKTSSVPIRRTNPPQREENKGTACGLTAGASRPHPSYD
ncbi:hypothetical protein EVAR_14779_1 [Eumeta japonica]|uniref:Uncharacterized protein n=1 Tax=Eumeta variegata TaxID=151549 RepID=A0A4C1TXP0_EUMVA|nr:hypothetical protein EVAR_14779_1 [Eumeta japonica]